MVPEDAVVLRDAAWAVVGVELRRGCRRVLPILFPFSHDYALFWFVGAIDGISQRITQVPKSECAKKTGFRRVNPVRMPNDIVNALRVGNVATSPIYKCKPHGH